MPNTSDSTRAYRPLDPPAPLRWRDWPIRSGLRRSWLPGLILVGGTAASLLLVRQREMSWIPPLMLAISLAKWWLPTDYEVSSRGITVGFCGRRRGIPWRAIGSIRELPGGIWLAPRNASRLVDGLRGAFLPVPKNREALIKLLGFYHLGPFNRLGAGKNPGAGKEDAVSSSRSGHGGNPVTASQPN